MEARPDRTSTLYTIPSEASFADSFVNGLLRRHPDPVDLASVLVLVPTRRAIRSLRDAFLRVTEGAPTLLPRLQAIGDLDEMETNPTLFADLSLSGAIPPAMPDLQRQLLLTRQILRLPPQLIGGEESPLPGQAARLAAELGRFLDRLQAEGKEEAGLADIVPDALAAHWQKVLLFLEIVTREWPQILQTLGRSDPVLRQREVLTGLARLWASVPPDHPIYVAGSTGSVPATRTVLATVARLQTGAVILPGLDTEMSDAAWEEVGDTHPQFMLKSLLQEIGMNRHQADVWTVDEEVELSGSLAKRMALVRDSLAPPAVTEGWRNVDHTDPLAKHGLARMDCAGPRQEAVTVATLMREALETPGKTAALVTPDRRLARSVAAELHRWGVEVDDSGGTPLAETPPATFLRAILEAIQGDFAPIPFLALCKHPLFALNRQTVEARTLARQVERLALRGPRPAPGIEGLKSALSNSLSAALSRSTPKADDDAALAKFVTDFEAALEPLAIHFHGPESSLRVLTEALITTSEQLAASEDLAGAERLWRGEAGEALADFLREFLEAADSIEKIPPTGFVGLIDALLLGRVVRPRHGRHPRLNIWGTLEARLQRADRMILGGLNEGSWPGEVPVDPWLSRPMAEALGLPPAERRIGQSAHDFVQALGADEVFLTRSEKMDGTPTVPSRWLLRLAALAGELPRRDDLASWCRTMDRPDRTPSAGPPQPTPPLAARPSQLSVTGVERWMRDPYSIYAQYVLNLKPLEEIDADPSAADRGNFMHDALDSYLRAFPAGPPARAREVLLEKGREAFGDALARPSVWAFWWPRFEQVGDWFLSNEEKREGDFETVGSEIKARMLVSGTKFPFTLTAKADRIDRNSDGALVIIDYKTGAVPKPNRIAAGYAPQLPLEGVLAEAGAFNGLAPTPVSDLEFWHLRGGTEDPVDIKQVKESGTEIAKSEAGLRKLVNAFADEKTPYLSNPRPEFSGYGDYDHLARVKEWRVASGEGDG